MDWLDLLAVQGTLKSPFQHHSSKTPILWHSAFFIVQLSCLYIWVECFVSFRWQSCIVAVETSKENQFWIFIGRTDVEAETPILWPPDANNWFIGKDPDAGKDWRQEEKGMTEDEMVGWHHQLYRHEFEQALGDGEGQGSLVCCSPRGHKESYTTERLNSSNKIF